MTRVMREQVVASNDRLTDPVPAISIQVVSVVVGLASFLATELMHYLLVPDIGRRWERLLAEGVSAFVVAGLTAGFHGCSKPKTGSCAAQNASDLGNEPPHSERSRSHFLNDRRDPKPGVRSSDLRECRPYRMDTSRSPAAKKADF